MEGRPDCARLAPTARWASCSERGNTPPTYGRDIGEHDILLGFFPDTGQCTCCQRDRDTAGADRALWRMPAPRRTRRPGPRAC